MIFVWLDRDACRKKYWKFTYAFPNGIWIYIRFMKLKKDAINTDERNNGTNLGTNKSYFFKTSIRIHAIKFFNWVVFLKQETLPHCIKL